MLRLLQFTTEAALRARIPISVCCEMAGDPRYTTLFVGLGIRELSMAPSKLLPVKRRIRTLMDQSDPGRIAALLDDFNEVS